MDIRFLVPMLVFVGGIYFLIRFKFFIGAFKKRKKIRYRDFFGGFSSFALALSGTLGVGNIFGVATAIIIGGVGSVFWILISAIFSAVIKYAEVSVSVSYNSADGMVSVIRESFCKLGGVISKLYAALALALAFIMGISLQGGSVVATASLAFGTPSLITALVVSFAVFFVIVGEKKKIKDFTSVILPLTTIIYIIMAICIISANFSRSPEVVSLRIKDAFSPAGAVGGVLGFVTSSRIREGFCCGILSNEAGAGTSSFAHTSGGNFGALGGALEVVFDTLVLCMLSAFAMLLSVPDIYAYESGAELVLSAFYSVLGGGGIGALLFVVSAFAVCTIVCWYYYADVCIRVLFVRDKVGALTPITVTCIFLGAFLNTDTLAVISHYLLLFLSVISLITLIKNSDRVVNAALPERCVIKEVESLKVSHRQGKQSRRKALEFLPRKDLPIRTKAPPRE